MFSRSYIALLLDVIGQMRRKAVARIAGMFENAQTYATAEIATVV
jgi:hypothetical protein